MDLFEERYREEQTRHDGLKATLILEGTRAHISVAQKSETIDCILEAMQLSEQWYKAFIRVQVIQADIEFS